MIFQEEFEEFARKWSEAEKDLFDLLKQQDDEENALMDKRKKPIKSQDLPKGVSKYEAVSHQLIVIMELMATLNSKFMRIAQCT